MVLAGNQPFFCCGRKVLLRPEKKVPVFCLAGCAIVSVFGSGDYDRKKRYSRLSSGLCCCVSFWFWREIGSFFCCGGKVLLRPEKKKFQLSVWRVVLLCQFLVLEITTGKKKFQSSVWRVVLLCQFLVLAITTGKKSSSHLSGRL